MEQERKSNGSERIATKFVTVISGIILLWLFFKYMLFALLPIGTAWLIASVIRPLSFFVGRKSKTSAKVCGTVIIVLSVFAIIYAGISIGGKLIREMTDFLAGAVTGLEGEDNIIRRTMDYFTTLPEKYHFLKAFGGKEGGELSEELYGFAVAAAREAAEKLSRGVTTVAADFIRGLPRFIFSTVVCIIAVFYLTIDYDGVKEGIRRFMTDKGYKRFHNICSCFSGGVSSYIRAYFILMTLTFGELFLGFVILDIRYAFFLALIIAVIDALPLIGSGAVIIPWSVLLFISGDRGRGVGMLILFGIMYVVRQFTEPRLIGKFMGIHPLITLTAAFAGFSLFGISGMITFPIGLYVLKLSVNDSFERNVSDSIGEAEIDSGKM